MISVKVQGGLGNQLFHYAAALQLSQHLNNGVLLNNSYFKEEKYKILYRLDKFKIDFTVTDHPHKLVEARSIFSRVLQKLFYKISFFPPLGFNVIKGDLLLHPGKKLRVLNKNKYFLLEGWLQKTDYFEKVKKQLAENLWLKTEFAVDNGLTKLIKNTDAVAVHIRRGDMLLNANFRSVGKEYYEKAIAMIGTYRKGAHFFVFSDEPDKAKDIFAHLDVPVTFVTEQSESLGYYGTKGDYMDFELMRLCKHYIIANSTFSWWPAYLSENPDKIVVAPSRWFENASMQKNLVASGLLQDDWHKL